MKFIDMFAGIGGFRSGLEKAGHECVGYIEWDKYARKSYQAIYNTEGEFTANDIREVKGIELPDVDLWTFGSPCQDISIAGKQKGIVKGGRSSMFFEVIRCLEERIGGEKTLPSILIMENVKALLSSNGGWDFARVIIEMDKVGYDAEWAVLNSSDVVPQNRERVYIIGHLRGTSTRQVFPIRRQGTDLVRTNPKIRVVGNTSSTDYKSQNIISSNGISPTLTATDYKHPKQVAVRQVGNIVKQAGFSNPQRGRIYSANGISPTLNTVQGGGLEPKVLIERPLKGLTKNGWHFEQNVFSTNSIAATLKAAGGSGNIPKIAYRPCLTPDRINKRQNGRRFKNCEDPAFTLTSQDRHGVLIESDRALAIRKLTPKECWRLQGFSDDQFEKAKQAGVSNSQLYKQAGNAVTVDVVEQIGKRL